MKRFSFSCDGFFIILQRGLLLMAKQLWPWKQSICQQKEEKRWQRVSKRHAEQGGCQWRKQLKECLMILRHCARLFVPWKRKVMHTTLYKTILDASTLRVDPKQCKRCKSFNHLVRDCPFLAQERPQEAAGYPPKPSATSFQFSGNTATDSRKFQKWFSAAGQEGCNLYQRKWCHLNCESLPIIDYVHATLVNYKQMEATIIIF